MAKKYTILGPAEFDLQEIMYYITADNPAAARKMRIALMEACRKLGDYPRMGQKREDLTDRQVRFWPVGNYMIVYNDQVEPIEIIRVYNASRNVDYILQ